MPANTQNNMKGTSPSPLMQRVIDQSWGQQKEGGTDAGIISKQFNQHPVPPGDCGATKQSK